MNTIGATVMIVLTNMSPEMTTATHSDHLAAQKETVQAPELIVPASSSTTGMKKLVFNMRMGYRSEK